MKGVRAKFGQPRTVTVLYSAEWWLAGMLLLLLFRVIISQSVQKMSGSNHLAEQSVFPKVVLLGWLLSPKVIGHVG
jgi:hypothetical protein